MDSTKAVIIVGGGLAGLTAAIHLSKLGLDVLLIEKNEFPKHKVCGEYLSNEVLSYLEWLNVDLFELNPSKLTKFEFSAVDGELISCDLPLGGIGLSRYALDAFLLQKASEQNCEIIQDQVEEIVYQNDLFNVFTKSKGVFKGEIVLGAYGKRSNLDIKLKRSFVGNKSAWLAVKAHYSLEFADGVVGLHNFDGGYCGVSKVENNVVNICYLASYESFKEYKNIDHYQALVLSKNPHLKKIFDKGKMLFDQPLSISQFSFDQKAAVENHILMIGDSAGLIHPLSGNGMAMAIHSAKIASELIADYRAGKIKSREGLENEYISRWNANFKKRIRISRAISFLLRKDNLSAIIMKILIKLPLLIPILIKQTHGPPIKS